MSSKLDAPDPIQGDVSKVLGDLRNNQRHTIFSHVCLLHSLYIPNIRPKSRKLYNPTDDREDIRVRLKKFMKKDIEWECSSIPKKTNNISPNKVRRFHDP